MLYLQHCRVAVGGTRIDDDDDLVTKDTMNRKYYNLLSSSIIHNATNAGQVKSIAAYGSV